MMILTKILKNFLFLILMLFALPIFAQVKVTGTIKSVEGTLVGVSVSEKGTTNGVMTNEIGQYGLTVGKNATLIFSMVGFNTQELKVNSEILDVLMEESNNMLDEKVITATRQPIRKIETTTAISVVGAKQLEALKPESVAEAIRGVAGMYVRNSQGRFRGGIFTRGFPDGTGNGLVYTGLLMDGLPTLATTSRPPDFAIAMDPNMERVEVVRGAAATLFGHGSAAGVVNMINKTGGENHVGMVRTTLYNNNVTENLSNYAYGMDFKVDANLNGPLSHDKKVRYNIGGYYVFDKGFRNLGYADHGGQLRANLDYLFEKGSLRFFAHYVDVTIQNMIDIPFRLDDWKPKTGWKTTDSYYSKNLDDLKYTRTNPNIPNYPYGKPTLKETRSVKDANKEGNYANGGHVGMNYQQTFGSWTLSEKIRYQSYAHGTKFNLGISPIYTDAAQSQLRTIIDGDGNDSDAMNELRIEKTIQTGATKHHLTIGNYTSVGLYRANTWALTGWMLPDKNNLTLRGFVPPAFSTPLTGSASRVDKYRVAINSFFAGDELKIGDKLILNLGARFDAINMNISGFYPDTINEMKRTEAHQDWSASAGFNYKTNERSALYGNVVRSYRMPDYDAYSAAKKASYWNNLGKPITNPRITHNEIVYNSEIGYRTGFGELAVDVAGFYTQIANRLVALYEGAVLVQKPFGNNQILGAELSLTYAPSAVPGFLLTTSYTLQKGTFKDFKIPVRSALSLNPDSLYGLTIVDDPSKGGLGGKAIDVKGKQLPGLPNGIWNFDILYETANVSFNLNSNRNSGFYQDAMNLFKRPEAMWYLNAGASIKVHVGQKSLVKIGVLVKNLLNTDIAERMVYNTDSDANLLIKQRLDKPLGNPTRLDAANTYFTGIPVLPRRVLVTVEYKF
jgi:outer membrane receptor protein involved in Fe transport